MKLNIQFDSTFRFQTCGSIATGTWRIKQDSLILTALTNVSGNDSSRHFNNGRYVYVIRNSGELHRRFYSEKKEKLLDYLVKVN
jgi:hypothetical protein